MATKTTELPRGIRLNASGSFEAYYRGLDRRLYSKSFSPNDPEFVDTKRRQTPDELERNRRRALNAAKAWLEANRPSKGKPWAAPTKVTVREVYDELVRYTESQGKHYAPSTLSLHQQVFTALAKADPTLLDTRIGDLGPPRVERAINAIAAPKDGARSGGMREKCRDVLRHVGRFAVWRGYITTNFVQPGFDVHTRKARVGASGSEGKDERMPSTAEIGKLIANIPDRYRALLLITSFMGLRPGECFALKVDDLDLDAQTITVRRSMTKGRLGPTKTGKERTLPMVPVPAMADALKSHMERYPSDDWLFTNDDGSPIESESFRKYVFTPAAKAAGVNGGISPNQMRHHAASYWLHRGANVLVVSKLLGHAKPSITLDVYAGLFDDSLALLASLGGADDVPALPSPIEAGPAGA